MLSGDQNSQEFEQKIGSDTPLHAILRHSRSAEEVKQFIDAFADKSKLAEMAQTVNARGESPIIMVYSTLFNYDEQNEIREKLIPFTLLTTYAPFGKVEEEKSLIPYAHLKGTPLYENLVLGVRKVQEAQKTSKLPATHPAINELPDEERLAIEFEVQQNREVYNQAIENITEKTEPSYYKRLKKKLDLSEKIFSETHGNCGELSRKILRSIKLTHPQKKASMWAIPSSDHSFIIIDHNTPNAIVCDPLMGEVFPASEIPHRLRAFCSISTSHYSFINFYPKLNPEYHYLDEQDAFEEIGAPDACIPYVTPYYRQSAPISKEMKYINRPYVDGETPLTTVVADGRLELLQSLLQQHADPDVHGHEGSTPLIKAAQKGCTKSIILLLEAKANIEKTDYDGGSPLVHAVKGGHEEGVKILLEHKASPNHIRWDGSTAIFVLPAQNSEIILNKLIEYKADINHQNRWGISPLYNIINLEKICLLKTILEAKADPNLKTKEEETPLHLASKKGLGHHVQLLLRYKADAKIQYQGKKTALDLAKENKKPEVIEILEQHRRLVEELRHSPGVLDIILQKRSRLMFFRHYAKNPVSAKYVLRSTPKKTPKDKPSSFNNAA